MAELAPSTLWFTIAALALGTYLIRFSFLGFLGGRTLPPLALRLLRYVPVAVFPALVAPQVLWPSATGGELDVPRLLAALCTTLCAALSLALCNTTPVEARARNWLAGRTIASAWLCGGVVVGGLGRSSIRFSHSSSSGHGLARPGTATA